MGDRRRTARIVTKKDADGALETFALDDEIVDVALFLENAGDLEFEL
jgi:hypothetical protein